MAVTTGLLIVAFCLVAEAFFSGSEMAMVNANRSLLQSRSQSGHRGSERALELLANEGRMLATCLVGTNLATIMATTVIVTMLVQHGLGEAVSVAIYVPMVLIFGEALPKTVSQHHADALAPIIAVPLQMVQMVLTPVLAVVDGWSSLLSKAMGTIQPVLVTRDDLLQMLDDVPHSDLDADDRRMIQRVLEMSETTVEECMTPLIDLVAVDEESSVSEASQIAIQRKRSRLVTFKDRIDNITGVVHHLDLLMATDDEEPIKSMKRHVVFVPEAKRADVMLDEMRRRGEHLVVVVDEYGGAVGIVTIEDLLEELVGEIRDERDGDGPQIRRIGERRWRVSARAQVEEVNVAAGIALPAGEYETIAGLILATCGRIPRPGEVIRVGGFTFRIQESNERAIRVVQLLVP